MFNVLVVILKPFLVKFKISLITYMGTQKFFSISFGVAVTMYPCQNYHFTFWFLKIYFVPFTIYFWQYIIFYFSRFSELWGMKCNCNNNGNLTPLSSVMWKTKAISDPSCDNMKNTRVFSYGEKCGNFDLGMRYYYPWSLIFISHRMWVK